MRNACAQAERRPKRSSLLCTSRRDAAIYETCETVYERNFKVEKAFLVFGDVFSFVCVLNLRVDVGFHFVLWMVDGPVDIESLETGKFILKQIPTRRLRLSSRICGYFFIINAGKLCGIGAINYFSWTATAMLPSDYSRNC